MIGVLSRVIPQIGNDGVVSIPLDAWDAIREIAKTEFDAVFCIHDHAISGAYHDGEFVPYPHYLIEFEVDGARAKELCDRVHPLVEELIETHTNTNLRLPAAR